MIARRCAAAQARQCERGSRDRPTVDLRGSRASMHARRSRQSSPRLTISCRRSSSLVNTSRSCSRRVFAGALEPVCHTGVPEGRQRDYDRLSRQAGFLFRRATSRPPSSAFSTTSTRGSSAYRGEEAADRAAEGGEAGDHPSRRHARPRPDVRAQAIRRRWLGDVPEHWEVGRSERFVQ